MNARDDDKPVDLAALATHQCDPPCPLCADDVVSTVDDADNLAMIARDLSVLLDRLRVARRAYNGDISAAVNAGTHLRLAQESIDAML